MSMNIQEAQAAHAALAALSPVLPVPLSERVQARNPGPPAPAPEPDVAVELAVLPRDEPEELETPEQVASNVVRETMRRDPNQVEPRPARDGASPQRGGTHGQQAAVVTLRPGEGDTAPAVGRPANGAGKPAASVPVTLPVPGAETTPSTTTPAVTAPSAGTPSVALPQPGAAVEATAGTSPAVAPDASPKTPTTAASASASASASAASLRAQRNAAIAAPSATVHAAAATAQASGQPGVTAAAHTEHGVTPEATPTAAPVTASAEQQGADSGSDGQSLADARRAEANLGTRQHFRAVRQAEALQTAMAQRADASSNIQVTFKSWGAGHSVSGRLEGGRLHMQPSSARVGQALTAAAAPEGTQLQIAVDSTDSATDERRQRRGSQDHA